jgi:putative transposase
VKRFEFVDRERAHYPVVRLCQLLAVSTSGYGAWHMRGPSAREQEDRRLADRIATIFSQNRCLYGAPKIHAELIASGVHCGRKRVARLMKAQGLKGCRRGHRVHSTSRDSAHAPAPDRVSRQFHSLLPNRLWVADVTYVPTDEGFLYLAVVLDVFSRRVVGWSMKDRITSPLVEEALDMAIRLRKPKAGTIHHSDQGRQYTSIAFTQRCQDAKIELSMGTAGDCYDNAMAESFFASLKCELIHRCRFHTRFDATTEIFKYIEQFYNRHRRHAALGYVSPENFERRHALTGLQKPSIFH